MMLNRQVAPPTLFICVSTYKNLSKKPFFALVPLGATLILKSLYRHARTCRYTAKEAIWCHLTDEVALRQHSMWHQVAPTHLGHF